MDGASTNIYAERVVPKKVEGAYKRKRILLVIGWIFVPIITIILSLTFRFLGWLLFLTPVIILLCVKLGYPVTKRKLDIEYEYIIATGHITVSLIYGKRDRKQWVDASIADMEVIAPYNDEKYRALADDPSIKVQYDAVSSMDAKDIYFCIFTNEHNEKSILYIEATNKVVGIFKFLNPRTVVSKLSI